MVETVTKTIRLYAKQKAFLESQALFRGFAAGISSGKSWVGAYDMIRRAKPNRLYMVTAPTYTLMADASFRSMEGVARDLDLISDIARGGTPYIKLKTGAEILFRSTHDPDMLRGPNLSGVWMDEASLMKQEAYDILIGRLRQEGEMGWLTATFTPKGKQHWTYKTFATGAPNTEIFFARSDENPFNPPTFVDVIRSQYTSTQVKQELEGLFLDIGGLHFMPRTWPRYTRQGDDYVFKISGMTERISTERIHHTTVSIIIGTDIAMTEKKTSDHTAFVVAGLTQDWRTLILDVVNQKIRHEHVGAALANICTRWNPNVVAADDDVITKAMQLEYRRHSSIPEVRLLPIKGRSKATRWSDAIIAGENKRIYLPEDAPWLDTYCDQLMSVTGIEKDESDDIADAQGIVSRQVNLLRGSTTRNAAPPFAYGGKSA